jgi:plastocyanin
VQGGSLEGLFYTTGTNILYIRVNASTDGKLLIKIPRLLLDAKKGDDDEDFFVLIDGEEVNFDEITTATDRTLTIEFAKGSEEIMIVGTTMIGRTTLQDELVVKILEGTSVPRDDEKYLKPQTLIIKKGQTVTWENCDSTAHTITSGTPEKGPDGNFDSSMFLGGVTYSETFDEKGTYRYFCMLHPWKEGKIIVTE